MKEGKQRKKGKRIPDVEVSLTWGGQTTKRTHRGTAASGPQPITARRMTANRRTVAGAMHRATDEIGGRPNSGWKLMMERLAGRHAPLGTISAVLGKTDRREESPRALPHLRCRSLESTPGRTANRCGGDPPASVRGRSEWGSRTTVHHSFSRAVSLRSRRSRSSTMLAYAM